MRLGLLLGGILVFLKVACSRDTAQVCNVGNSGLIYGGTEGMWNSGTCWPASDVVASCSSAPSRPANSVVAGVQFEDRCGFPYWRIRNCLFVYCNSCVTIGTFKSSPCTTIDDTANWPSWIGNYFSTMFFNLQCTTCGPCTNGPSGSYYTSVGAGPTSNCNWACNSGYTQSGSTCVLPPYRNPTCPSSNASPATVLYKRPSN